MLTIQKDPSVIEEGPLLGLVEAGFPEPSGWDMAAYASLVQEELARVRQEGADYDRAARFGSDPYSRYFKKYKKTYPVLQQLESFLLKGRPFPETLPVCSLAFLAELRTGLLLGMHDAGCIRGALTLFAPGEKLPFPGLGGRESHSYPGDLTGRDEEGILFSRIGGPDARTCLTEDSRQAAYLIFGVPGCDAETIRCAQELVCGYARTLAPGVALQCRIV